MIITSPAHHGANHDKPGAVRVYLGTGRGIWRVDLANADLSVTKSDAPDPVVSGTDLAYTIQVNNQGPDVAQNASVRDVLPDGIRFRGFTSPAGWACTTPIPGHSGTVECRTPTMGLGTQTFTVMAHADVVPPSGTVISNTARAFSANIDPDQTDNVASQSTTVNVRADADVVSLLPTSQPGSLLIGTPFNLTMRKVYANRGPSAPVDIVAARTASATAGASVTPTSSSQRGPMWMTTVSTYWTRRSRSPISPLATHVHLHEHPLARRRWSHRSGGQQQLGDDQGATP